MVKEHDNDNATFDRADSSEKYFQISYWVEVMDVLGFLTKYFGFYFRTKLNIQNFVVTCVTTVTTAYQKQFMKL